MMVKNEVHRRLGVAMVFAEIAVLTACGIPFGKLIRTFVIRSSHWTLVVVFCFVLRCVSEQAPSGKTRPHFIEGVMQV